LVRSLAWTKGEAAEPGHVDLLRREAFDHGGVVADRRELHFESGFLFQVLAQRLELALEFGRRFVGNRRYAQGVGEAGGGAQHQGEGKGAAGNQSGHEEHGFLLGLARDYAPGYRVGVAMLSTLAFPAF
jgi:hypothetical protein